jgi:D-serine deaminase-like pyridoxal phosphate-dependent protein
MRPDDLARVRVTDKGLPAWASGLSLAEFAARRPRLADAGFLFPLLTCDGAAVRANIDAMASYARERGVLLCPHGKTTMSPELIDAQLASGAWGITAATISQVRAFRHFGVGRILLANELVDPAGLDWLLTEFGRDSGFDCYVYVDSRYGLEAVRDALARRGAGRELALLVELGVPGRRTGCRTVPDAVELAAEIRTVPGARLAGIAGYEGVIGTGAGSDDEQSVRRYLRDLRAVVEAVARPDDDLFVTAGGSVWFDVVVDELGPSATGGRARVVLRSGCYVTHDHGLYAAAGPTARGSGPALRPALRLWAHILSTPEPGLALAGFGRRDCSFDAGLPIPLHRLGDGVLEPVTGVEVVDLNDQHAFLRGDAELRVGDLLAFGISHPCTTFDKWRVIPVVDDDLTVTDCLTTWF